MTIRRLLIIFAILYSTSCCYAQTQIIEHSIKNDKDKEAEQKAKEEKARQAEAARKKAEAAALQQAIQDSIRRAQDAAWREREKEIARQQALEAKRLQEEEALRKKAAEEAKLLKEASRPKPGYTNEHEWIDLGLPSGLKWASCNIGASSPSDKGFYISWGETMSKSEYWQENSATRERSFGDIAGNSQTDAARALWGSTWRLPTKADMDELIMQCSWRWTTINGVPGYNIIGPNDNSIFLPAVGFITGVTVSREGVFGYYWTTAPLANSAYAYGLYFNESGYEVGGCDRSLGVSVRPVIQ